MKNFYQALINTALANITSSFLWFALTFWVYLETHSVLATAIIGGTYMLMISVLGIVFGTIVDHNKKKNVMVLSSLVTWVSYGLAGLMFLAFSTAQLIDWTGPVFWFFTFIILAGSVVESMRNIALSTVVTLLVSKEGRDKANGLVGAVGGVGFIITSVLSGLSIGYLGMGWTLVLAIIATSLVLMHVVFYVHIPEKRLVHDKALDDKRIDIKGSIAVIAGVPGLAALILFTTFNNFLGGAFMSLMDPYGLTLFSVQQWGIVFGVAGTGFVVGGLFIAKFGLGKKPLRTMLLTSLAMSLVGMIFTLREWWLLYAAGIYAYMVMIPIVEAAEQTVLQRVVPYERQGRVFGFAQSIETAAMPLMAFIIGPLAQFVVIPYMNSVEGRQTLGWLLGSGQVRGIALIFVLSSFVLLLASILALMSRSYKRLSVYYQDA